MKDEILAAVLFLVRIIEKNEKFSKEKLETFQSQLINLLTEKFKNHWFPDCPAKGQGYRCIRVNGLTPVDFVLEKAATKAGLRYGDLQLPIELTVWVDPNEVCCRFGESEGSYCTLASFNNKESDAVVSEQIDRALTVSPASDVSNSSTESPYKPVQAPRPHAQKRQARMHGPQHRTVQRNPQHSRGFTAAGTSPWRYELLPHARSYTRGFPFHPNVLTA